jgi:hypothetical protein
MVSVNSSLSIHRHHVDEALAQRGTTLTDFIAGGRAQGKNLDEIWMDLRQATGVRFSMRTLYRWVERLEVSA